MQSITSYILVANEDETCRSSCCPYVRDQHLKLIDPEINSDDGSFFISFELDYYTSRLAELVSASKITDPEINSG